MNTMYSCPKFYHCNSPKCPLDTRKEGIRLSGEKPCRLDNKEKNRLRSTTG